MAPDDFRGRPYAWACNQAGHCIIGIGAAVAASAIGLWWPIPLAVAVVYWFVAEYLLQRAGLFWDGVTDAGFVAAGATLPTAILAGTWQALALCLVAGVALAIGAWRRWK